MSFFRKYKEYLIGAFVDHSYLLRLTIIYAILCLAGGYFLADFLISPQDMVDYEYLAQETFFSFGDMMEIIVNNCYLNMASYVEAIFFGIGPIYDMTLNIGLTGVVSRATEHACGDPFLFIKLTFLHGLFEDMSTVLNSFAGFILFSFIVRYIKDVISPSEYYSDLALLNSWIINKKHLYQSLAIFILAFLIMIFAGFLEEYISVPFGNFLASVL